MSRITGSKAALAASGCRWWMRDDVPWDDSAGEYAARGRENHAAIAALVRGGTPTMPEDAAQCAQIAGATEWMVTQGLLRRASGDSVIAAEGALVPIPMLRAEVAFAFDLSTGKGRELLDPPGADARWYADPAQRAAYAGPGGRLCDSEVCMRVDLLATGCDEQGVFLWVRDWKFHAWAGAYVDASAQVELAMVTVASAYGIDRVRGGGVHVWDDHVTEEVIEEHDEFALSDLRRKVRAWFQVPANDAAPVPGAHCATRYCPARSACPTTQEAAAQLLPAERLVRTPLAGPITSADHARDALVLAGLLTEAAKVVRAKAKAYLQGPSVAPAGAADAARRAS